MDPHVITLPLLFKAANAPPLEYIATTLEDKLAATVVELPPLMPPHVITLPLLFKAANASSVEYIATTPED